MAEDASGPAAREASGPLAPGAHPREGKLALARPGRYATYVETGRGSTARSGRSSWSSRRRR
eukprot:936591-Alexandrium_andersonii.AAC.1